MATKKLPAPKSFPTTRQGWMDWYVKRFNKTGIEFAAVQALWFYLNIIEFGDRSYSPLRDKETA